MPEKVELLSYGREGLTVVLGCGEKIESEDGQRIRFERGAIFLYIGFYDYRVLGKKNSNFCIFFLNDADVENCDASGGFGYIYIYIYI